MSEMDGLGLAEVKDAEGQHQACGDVNWPVNEDLSLSHLLINIDLVRDEILASLDGSALINLSCLNRSVRHIVTSSHAYKVKVKLRVDTKTMDYLTTTTVLPEWAVNLNHLTLVCTLSESHDKFSSSLARTLLPNLSTLVLANDSNSYIYSATFLDNILSSCSTKLKSLSLSYDLLLNPITFQDLDILKNLEELKFTTSSCLHMKILEESDNFQKNLNNFASNCIRLKSFSYQTVVKFEGRYGDFPDEDGNQLLDGILAIIKNNSEGLENLEFGILKIDVDPYISSKLAVISLPKLKFLNLRAEILVVQETEANRRMIAPGSVLDMLKNNLSQPGELNTLKLTTDIFPLELFDLIPQKFPHLKSLSLKATKFASFGRVENPFSFITSLHELEELEIGKFTNHSHDLEFLDFGPMILDLVDFFQENKLRKLSVKGMNCAWSPAFLDGIAKMSKLKELALTGSSLYLEDFLKICSNLKGLEKLEISNLHLDKFNAESPTLDPEVEIDYSEILTAFSTLKCLKELFIEVLSGDIRELLGSISFPYLKTLTLRFHNLILGQDEVENIIGLNEMLKELKIIRLKDKGEVGWSDEEDEDPDQNFEIVNQRYNLKIDISSIQMFESEDGRFEIRENNEAYNEIYGFQNYKFYHWVPGPKTLK